VDKKRGSYKPRIKALVKGQATSLSRRWEREGELRFDGVL
jgi:hypothetical protein